MRCRIQLMAGLWLAATAPFAAGLRAAEPAMEVSAAADKTEALGPPSTVAPGPGAERAPAVTSSASCASGACAGGTGHTKKSHDCWHALARWVCYQPVRLPLACNWQPSPYRPPLYTWFTCSGAGCVSQGQVGCGPMGCGPNGCAAPAYTAQPAVIQTIAKARRREGPLPKPEMPNLAPPEPSLVSTSSVVMGDKKQPGTTQTINYKAMPIMPVVPPSDR